MRGFRDPLGVRNGCCVDSFIHSSQDLVLAFQHSTVLIEGKDCLRGWLLLGLGLETGWKHAVSHPTMTKFPEGWGIFRPVFLYTLVLEGPNCGRVYYCPVVLSNKSFAAKEIALCHNPTSFISSPTSPGMNPVTVCAALERDEGHMAGVSNRNHGVGTRTRIHPTTPQAAPSFFFPATAQQVSPRPPTDFAPWPCGT
jgi:hypothetical protein